MDLNKTTLDQENHKEDVHDKEMSFFDHIDALRKHLFRSAITIVIFSIVGFVYMDFIFHEVMLGPLRTDFFTYRKMCEFSHYMYNNDQICVKNINYVLQNTEMAGQFLMAFKLAFLTGLILSMPVLLWQVWLFVKPALSSKEKGRTRGFVFYTTFLFFLGVLFGYFILCPISVNFLSNYTLSPLVKNEINMQNVISFMSLIVIGTGLIFELPVLMYFLAKIGLISSKFLIKYRRHAFIVILIIAAIATPPDIVSQVILTIPLYSLFEIGIIIIKRVEKQKAEENG